MRLTELKEEKFVFICGAGRSGTNLLASALSTNCGGCNLGELRFIWSLGQAPQSLDYRSIDEATPERIKQIRHFFLLLTKRRDSTYFIDKTTANVLRMGFVEKIFPNSIFIHVIRDVRDNLFSRFIQFRGGHGAVQIASNSVLDRYLDERVKTRPFSEKVGFLGNMVSQGISITRSGALPISRIPFAIRDSVLPRILGSMTGTYPQWGERVEGFDEWRLRYGELTALALQWKKIVADGRAQAADLTSSKYFEVKFEDMLSQPVEVAAQLAAVDAVFDGHQIGNILDQVVDRQNTRLWEDRFSQALLDSLEPKIRPTLEALGYKW